jgi:mRNA interferase RelE/StbE
MMGNQQYRIQYHPDVLKDDLPKLNKKEKQRIKKAIEQKLTVDPLLFGAPLRKSLQGYRKLRVGDYRIIFKIQKTQVFVLTIKHRRFVYQNTEKRM